MSAGHTPGPLWVEGSIYDGYSAAVVGRVATKGNADRETRTLAHVRQFPDAILFSAAPDLLAALDRLNAIARPSNWDDDDDPVHADAWRFADAALAKARGQ